MWDVDSCIQSVLWSLLGMVVARISFRQLGCIHHLTVLTGNRGLTDLRNLEVNATISSTVGPYIQVKFKVLNRLR